MTLTIRPIASAAMVATMGLSIITARQSTARSTPSFEVATIKQNNQLDAGGTLRMQPGGLFLAVNVDTMTLILGAYRTAERRIFRSEVIGAPSWFTSERYDITAKVSGDLAARPQGELFAQLPRLLQALLEDRFALHLHHETRDLDVYVLTIKNPQFGPGLRRSSLDCAVTPTACGIQSSRGHVCAASVDIETLLNILSGTIDRPLVNQTDLTGHFAVALDWSPDQGVSDSPSIFTAVQDQLGLKLTSAKAPVDVLVIDHVERPMPD